MPNHRFQVGQIVFLEGSRNLNIPGGEYVTTKILPERNGGFEYRVNSSKEPHQRVVREDHLKALETQTELKLLQARQNYDHQHKKHQSRIHAWGAKSLPQKLGF